jgi:tRNA (adenine-N(1)-)-methyltransferase non-catalytic subunit
MPLTRAALITHAATPVLQAGDDIIDALCKSSATYDTKTEYAQDKYKKRKARKYLVLVTVRRPTARLMCQVRQQQQASK